jgi:phosphatidylserine decarboxylase
MRIHREGYRFLTNTAIGLTIVNIIALIGAPSAFRRLLPVSLGLFAFLCSFFRQPQRITPDAPNAVISPADGQIVGIKKMLEPEFLGDECIRISIFLSVFNVHINWVPITGRVIYEKYHPGKYLVAFHPKSSELNERQTVVIQNDNGTCILVRQIAGLLARRIVCYVRQAQAVHVGEELGFIKFGSRLDIFLPSDSTIKVQMYERIRGGETILAEIV